MEDIDISQSLKNVLQETLKDVKSFLLPDGLDVDCEICTLPSGCLAEYEAGSVFEKVIHMRIDLESIQKEGKKEKLLSWETGQQVAITLWHETGHAIIEQIIDWAENIDEVELLVNGPFGEKYFDVFNDDHLSEEELVENFARAVVEGNPNNLLRQCWKELNQLLAD